MFSLERWMGLPSVNPADIQEGAWVQDTGLCSSASASMLLGNHLWVVKGPQKENSIAQHWETSWLTEPVGLKTQVREGSGCLLGELTMKPFRQPLIHASHQ